MDYLVLFNEINTDPLGRGYSGMSDAEVADDLNIFYRTRDRDVMTASEVYNAININEYLLLTADQQQEVWNILHMSNLNPFGLEATRFIAIFGASSNTIINLAGVRVYTITRAQELGLGEIYEGYVTKARALGGA